MKKALNTYSVVRNGSTWIGGLLTFDDAITLLFEMLKSQGYTESEINTITVQDYLHSGGDINDKVSLLRYQNSYWFSPNKFGFNLRSIRSSKIVELDERFDIVDNKILESMKSFNGDSLRLNAIEEPSTWKPHKYQVPEVRLAMSVQRYKGLTTLPKEKKGKQQLADYITAEKISRLNTDKFWPLDSIRDEIIRLKSDGKSRPEVFKALYPNYKGGRNQFKKLLTEVYYGTD